MKALIIGALMTVCT